jgi:ribosomal protein S18 acetylase RimI-like enzyme
MTTSFRPYARTDRAAVTGILHRTGFLGEDLAGTGLFDDRRLFALTNTDGYLRFQKDHAFVAVDDANGRVIGYIIGTPDSAGYDRTFTVRMYPRIAARGFLVSWWKYPESFRHVLGWAREYSDAAIPFYADYPAHLHINVLPEYQRGGIGEKMMSLFEEHLAALGVKGVHLGTSNRNRKAIPFYEKHGYTILVETPATQWHEVEGLVSVIFGKKL